MNKEVSVNRMKKPMKFRISTFITKIVIIKWDQINKIRKMDKTAPEVWIVIIRMILVEVIREKTIRTIHLSSKIKSVPLLNKLGKVPRSKREGRVKKIEIKFENKKAMIKTPSVIFSIVFIKLTYRISNNWIEVSIK